MSKHKPPGFRTGKSAFREAGIFGRSLPGQEGARASPGKPFPGAHPVKSHPGQGGALPAPQTSARRICGKQKMTYDIPIVSGKPSPGGRGRWRRGGAGGASEDRGGGLAVENTPGGIFPSGAFYYEDCGSKPADQCVSDAGRQMGSAPGLRAAVPHLARSAALLHGTPVAAGGRSRLFSRRAIESARAPDLSAPPRPAAGRQPVHSRSNPGADRGFPSPARPALT